MLGMGAILFDRTLHMVFGERFEAYGADRNRDSVVRYVQIC